MTRLVAALGILLFVTPSQAVLISVTGADGSSNIDITEGTSTVDVFVRITGEVGDASNEIANLNYTVVVGDGGPAVGGTDNVPIQSVSYLATGTGSNASVWDTVSGSLDTTAAPALPSASASILGVGATTAGDNATFGPAQVLARLTLDTSALVDGDSLTISLFSGIGPSTTAERFIPDPTPTPTDMFDIESLVVNNGGNALLTVSAVPEPSSFVLLSLGIASFGARRRSRRRRTELTA